jgi:hypothetical protein
MLRNYLPTSVRLFADLARGLEIDEVGVPNEFLVH